MKKKKNEKLSGKAVAPKRIKHKNMCVFVGIPSVWCLFLLVLFFFFVGVTISVKKRPKQLFMQQHCKKKKRKKQKRWNKMKRNKEKRKTKLSIKIIGIETFKVLNVAAKKLLTDVSARMQFFTFFSFFCLTNF